MRKPTTSEIERQVRTLMDRGRLMEEGWMTYRGMMEPSAPPIQLRECRLAFWSGASYLFQAIIFAMEAGKLDTPGDAARMEQLSVELLAFERQLQEARDAPEKLTFTCPRCGAISYNSHDIRQGYCGVCHDWCR